MAIIRKSKQPIWQHKHLLGLRDLSREEITYILDTARGFRPGDFVTVRVEEPAVRNVVRLPASAYDSDGHVLVLAEDDDRLEEISVDLVRRQGDDVLVRASGLAGREVVRELSPLLGPGIAVRPVLRDGARAAV